MIRGRWSTWCIFLQVALLVFLAGCANKPAQRAPEQEVNHIKKVADLATQFGTDPANKGKMPKDLDQLKAWALKTKKAEEADFNSTRDNEPYVLIPTGMGVIVHEKTAREDGKRWMTGMTPTPIEGTDSDIERFTAMSLMGAHGKPR